MKELHEDGGLHVLQVDARRLGLPSPPARVHLRFIRGPHHWTLLARVNRELDGPFRKWLIPLDARVSVRPDGGPSEQILRATLQRLPAPLAELLGLVRVRRIIAQPDGGFLVRFQGSRKAVEVWARATPGVDGVGIPSYRPVLSDRQHEALHFAVEHGYYDLPRRTNLRHLAKKFDLSAAALSELLRRAEGHLVKKYVHESEADGMPARSR